MKVKISAAALAMIALAIIIVTYPVLAQDSSGALSSRRSAPVGHRQPTAADVERSRAEKGASGASASAQRSSDIDQRLIICHGC
jgi:hypothetical protein